MKNSIADFVKRDDAEFEKKCLEVEMGKPLKVILREGRFYIIEIDSQ